MSRENLKSGRIDQKRRTRIAIMEAAARLMAEGRTVLVQDVAEAAGVSRATVYRYFPNPDALIHETQLHVLVRTPAEMFPTADGDPAERATHVLDHLQELTRNHEPAFRQFMRSVMDNWLETGGKSAVPLRGGRRLALLQAALEPVRPKLDEQRFNRLVEALAMLVSLDTYFAGRDICRMTPKRIRETLTWVIHVLVSASVEETDSGPAR